jgi:outer membrane lipoprotein-sorting protein
MSRVITMKKLKSILMLTLITVALTASGCTEKNLSAEEIATQILDKQNSTQDYSYTMHITSYIGEKTEESKFKTLFKKPNMSKEVITEDGKENQTFVVSDGEFIWSYIPETNEVIKTKLPENSEPTQNDYINAVGEFLNSTNVTLLGMESIDGRTTYLLETTPKENEEASQLIDRTKIWVDKETWMPLRYEIYNGNGNLTLKIEIRDLKVNSGIPDSEFRFEIPKGAKIVETKEAKLPEKLSLEEATKKASFKILTPEYLPEGYTFSHSMVYNNSEFSPTDQVSEIVDLTYTNEKPIIGITGPVIALTETINENHSSYAKVMDNSEDIMISGIEGKYVSIGDMKILIWKLGNVNLSLCASLDKDEMLKIAESISEKA